MDVYRQSSPYEAHCAIFTANQFLYYDGKRLSLIAYGISAYGRTYYSVDSRNSGMYSVTGAAGGYTFNSPLIIKIK